MFSSSTIGKCLNLNTVGSKFGIEVEVETNSPLPSYQPTYNEDGALVASKNIPKGWTPVKDGSLRGFSMEYVTATPKNYADTIKSLDVLKDHLMTADRVINHDSPRVSTHVHLNVSDLTYIQLFTLVSIWWSIENIMVDFCGPSRVGNNFCCRVKDATRLASNVFSDVKMTYKDTSGFSMLTQFHEEDCKYSALNLAPVRKIGTIEFRSFGGLDFNNMSKFNMWLGQIEHMSLLVRGSTYRSPLEVFQSLDKLGVDKFLSIVLTKDMYEYVKSNLPNSYKTKVEENEKFVAILAWCVPFWKEGSIPTKKKRVASSLDTAYWSLSNAID